MGSGLRRLLEPPAAHVVGRAERVEPGKRVTLLDLSGEDAAARSIHVLVSVAPVIDASRLDAEAIARREDVLSVRVVAGFGAGGHRAELELDALRGLGFTLSAASIRVDAINDGPAPVEIGAFASYAEVRAHAPTLTRLGPELAAADAWTLEVPPFASGLEVFALDAALRVDVGFGRAGERWLYAEELDPNRRMPSPLPLANGCSRVRVTNRGPGAAIPLAVFTLAL
ncbi:MAG: hypothetical protein K8H88_15265 [Sandaracinaceae bacterium]|nr:hypothetical protein [Sandaracinaceae bacterium]